MSSKQYAKKPSWQPDRSQSEKTDTPAPNRKKPLEVADIPPGAMMDNVERSMANQETPATPPPEFVQAKLTLGQPNDKYEQEADRVAKEVVQSIRAPEPAASGEPSLQCKTEAFQEIWQPTLQAKGNKGGEASGEFERTLNRTKSSGQPLDANLQRSMGSAMGADFSGVKVHTDSTANDLNQSIQAKAFTTGKDVFFKQGEYQPGSQSGQELIAHELTHVVQQNGVQRSLIQRNGPIKNKAGENYPHQPRVATGVPAFEATEDLSLQVAQTNSLLIAAQAAKENFKAIVEGLVAKINAHFGDNVCQHTGFEYALKSWESSYRKAKTTGIKWNEGVAHALMDVVRATISCNDYDAMMVAKRVLAQEIQFGIAQYCDLIDINPDMLVRDSFNWQMEKQDDKGYGDIKGYIPVKFVRESGPEGDKQGIILAEMQVLHEQLHAVKQTGGGHTFYEVERALEDYQPLNCKIFEPSDEAIHAARELSEQERFLTYLKQFPLSLKLLYRVLHPDEDNHFVEVPFGGEMERKIIVTTAEEKALKDASNRFYTEQFWDNPSVTI
ncbi:MAG: DUF4157 domain-containing protein [Cyanobacteria bacterium SBLK]|nr:DUF4157 domain-containing protein [Cyanobacteria bacterium SBLK]